MNKKDEDYFLEESNVNATAASKEESVVQEVHLDRPEVIDPKTTAKEKADQTFQSLEEMIEGGYRFSDYQMDVGIRLSLTRIPHQKKAWFIEICTMITHRPFWQVLWGSFNRVNENGQAQAPILDPTWESGSELLAEWSVCKYCGAKFNPQHYGQIFCSNEHSSWWAREQKKEAVNG